jgi:hypothetical protein
VFPVAVDLARFPVRDEDAGRLKEMTDLWRVAVDGRELTDAGLARLVGIQDLRELSLSNLRVGDDGARRLAGLKELTFLDLSGSRLGDAALQQIGTMTQLRELVLTNTGVGDTGLAHLRGLTNLKVLRVDGTGVTSAGLTALSGLRNLENVDLSGTRVDDTGLTRLTELPNLRTLGLNATRVTDAAVGAIVNCRFLYRVELRGARVSARGHAALEKVFSKTKLQWSEPNRTAALAVLAAGGTVRLRSRGGRDEQVVKSAGQLPEDYFLVTGVTLARSANLPGDLAEKLAALTDAEFDGLTAADFSGTGLDAEAVDAILRALPVTVTDLSLAGTPAGDAQMARCAERLLNLRRLDVSGTRVTPAGAAALRSRLANCRVDGPTAAN